MSDDKQFLAEYMNAPVTKPKEPVLLTEKQKKEAAEAAKKLNG